MRTCAKSKTELQKARRLAEITGENRAARRKKIRQAVTGSTETDDALKDKIDSEFASKAKKPKRNKA